MSSRFAPIAVVLSLVFAVSAGARVGEVSRHGAFPGRNGEIVFSSLRPGNGNYQLYLMRRDGTRQRRITRGRGDKRFPKWSPDGKWIAYMSDRSKRSGKKAYEIDVIYVVRADGTGSLQLTRHAGSNSYPSWSPDGKRIVFDSDRRHMDIDDIYVMNANGSGQKRLTSVPGEHIYGDWQPLR